MADKGTISFFRNPKGTLELIDGQGRHYPDVWPLRLFPLTDPDHWISICDADAKELLCIEDPADLSLQSRQALKEELQIRLFIPVIRRIIKISTAWETMEWKVETDRGRTGFTVRDEDDVHRLGGGRMLIIDSYGTRYLIPDIRLLDRASRKSLAHLI